MLFRIACVVLTMTSVFAEEPETLALPRHVLTNEGLVVLARAGLGDNLLVDLVKHKRTQFDTSADAIAHLARQGISEPVIRAVVEKQEQVQMRKPRLAIAPATNDPGTPAIELEPGEILMMPTPPQTKKARTDSDRWYKLTMR